MPASEPDPRDVLVLPAPPPDTVVRYGPHADHVADVRLPRAGSGPLVVVIHGGFWRDEYDRAHTGHLAAALADLGYAVAQLEYRRTGPGAEGGWPATFEDVVAGVGALPALVAAAARELGRPVPDEGPPILVGHSAGGHLALWYAAHAPAEAVPDGVLALAPVADLAEAHRLDLDGGAVEALLGGGPEARAEAYAAADPLPSIPLRLPTVILHGTTDVQVPIALSRRFVAEAGAVDNEITLLELREVGHFELIDPRSAAWRKVTEALRSLRR
ncbi:lipase [Asanoa ishikariensis]|uniref:Prolyl oligopeptidase family protein n=1 Tax=Asanoa ishikariensis TaxID=137265 RepID=A0A1H3KLR2_9ACTN|nr:alpha/beta hydrolase [Asanoa ishikariensis]GIF69839.1 lipase [Asanoa ishikariensis]SDY52524.1 Prolyl oligopeptidase family protein [Asanoa ishikariensis]